ncbi:hypothetical protein EGW08_017097 [Elysia chlorotica]|uniref:Uncharacterized protein n=1 Tax=Elysia chlorotica TaxID=188477 RepID=A0A3S1B505_ELYCH|nr:hypothetical protein EGW08_017097 [Elysia chlorotica]
MPLAESLLTCQELMPLAETLLTCQELMPLAESLLTCQELMPLAETLLTCPQLMPLVDFPVHSPTVEDTLSSYPWLSSAVPQREDGRWLRIEDYPLLTASWVRGGPGVEHQLSTQKVHGSSPGDFAAYRLGQCQFPRPVSCVAAHKIVRMGWDPADLDIGLVLFLEIICSNVDRILGWDPADLDIGLVLFLEIICSNVDRIYGVQSYPCPPGFTSWAGRQDGSVDISQGGAMYRGAV